jgi:hypothetical protein
MPTSQKIFVSFWLLLLLFISFPKLTFGAGASLLFNPQEKTVGRGTQFDINIDIDTAGESVGGAGAKIRFDPAKVNIISITPGAVFTDYPAATFDNTTGKLNVSGIVGSPTDLYSGKGVFATIKMVGLTPGTAQMSFEFVPGDTTDSNIAITSAPWDTLTDVNTLNINITETNQQVVVDAPVNSGVAVSSAPGTPTAPKKLSLIERITEFFGSIFGYGEKTEMAEEYDPYGPIERQEPNNNPNSYMAPQQVDYERSNGDLVIYLIGGLVALLVLTMLFVIFKNLKIRRAENAKPPTVINNL